MRWVHRLFSRLFLAPRIAHRSRQPRLAVELLETRLVPSSLQVSISPHTIVEAPGPASTAVGTVTRVNTDNTQQLTVNLTSSNNAEVSLPTSVVIPANQASTTFSLSAVPDSVVDGTQNVAITGSAQVLMPLALDTTFGGGGVSPSGLTQAVAVQADGKIVTAGMRYNGGNTNAWDLSVTRYNGNGTLDTTFGGSGTVYTDVSGQSDKPESVVIQSDGKIVVGGIGGDGPHFFWELARYNPDGTLDATFGTGGKVITNPNANGYYNEIWDLALQSDGKILAAGYMDNGQDGTFAVARYNPNGTLDTTFGSGGIATSNPSGSQDRAFSIALQPGDGKIILAGGAAEGNYYSEIALTRFTASGALDTGFGSGGTVLTNLANSTFEEAHDVVLQPDGKIVAVGYVNPSGGSSAPVYDFAVLRYNANGSLDGTFGSGGVTTTDLGGNDEAIRAALQPDGRIEVAGYGGSTTSSNTRTFVASYTTGGTLIGSLPSPHFGTQGQGLALQSDGGIVVVSNKTSQIGSFVERYYDSTLITGSDTVGVQDSTGPLANNDAYTASENTPLTVSATTGVLANDTDSSGAALTAIQLSSPANGTVTLNGDGSFTYTPNTGFVGSDSFTYKANDGTSDSNTATVTITVAAPAPTASKDSYAVNENTTLSVAAPGVLANDTDPNNNPLTAVLVTSPAHGTLQLASNGGFTYTPATYFSGTDSFTYKATNGGTSSAAATVSITVNHVNQPPTAVNHSYSLNENGSLSIQVPGILANSSDPDGDPLTAVLYAGPAGTGPFHGTLSLNPNGAFVYTPNANFSGTDSFTFRAYDGSLYSNVATVTLTVKAIPPTAANDAYTVNEYASLTVGAPGVLANDTATTSDALSASLVSGVAHGSLTLNANGSFTYTPFTGFYGTDSFTYHDTESGFTSNTATVTITVNYVDRPPVAVNDAFTVNEDSTLTVAPPTGATTSLTMTSQPGDYIGQGANYSYTPATGTFQAYHSTNDNYVGFSYQAVDPNVWWNLDFEAPSNSVLVPGYYGNAARYPFQAANQPGLDVSGEGRGSDTLTGNFTVVQAVYGPSGQVIYFDATFEQHSEGATPALFGEIKYAAPATSVGVLGNDSDPDGQALTAAVVTGPAHGSLTFNADGTFSYTPAADYFGPDSFTYQASDGTLNSNPATVTLTVNPVNDAPSFVKGPDQTIVEGAGPQTVAGWATAISAGPPNEASQTLNFLVSTDNSALFAVAPAIDPTTGTLTYTPAPNILGTATVTVRLQDSGGTANGGVDTSPPQTFPITVNDATPTFTLSGPASVDVGSPYVLGLTADDPDTVTAWTVTWGDGSVQTVSGNPSSVTHLFPYGASNYTVSATATDEDGTHAAANTVAVSVIPVHLNVTGPATATAGSSFSLTVTALDAFGNLDTTYTGTIHFASSDGLATLPADWMFLPGDAGSHVFTGVSLDTAGGQSVTATDTARSTITGSWTTTVSPAAATRLTVSGPSSATAGVAFTETVTALDAFGNVATGYTGTVHFTSSDGQAVLPADSTLSNGTGSYAVTLKTAGSQALTASDTIGTVSAGTEANIVVNPAAAATLTLTGFPSATTAGVAQAVTVTVRDAFGNLVTGYTGTVRFSSSDAQAGLPADYTFNGTDGGVHTFNVVLKTSGTQSLTVTDRAAPSLTSTQGGIAVSAAAAATFTLSGYPAATAGTAHTFTVTARDAFGNVATSYRGTVRFTSSDAQAGLPANYTFAAGDAGLHTFTATLKTAGAQSLTATDTVTAAIAGTQTGIVISPAAATLFQISAPTSVNKGTAFNITVTALDAYGNVATGYRGTVHFTSSDKHAILPPNYTFVSGDNGVHTFTVTFRSSRTQSITVTDTLDKSVTGSANVTVR